MTGQGLTERSRILGCLLGAAVGDALCKATARASVAGGRSRIGPSGVRPDGVVNGQVAAITAGTQMALFTAEGLLRAHARFVGRGICHAPSVVHHAYLRWLITQGVTPRARVASFEDWPDGWLVGCRQLWYRRAPGRTCLSALAEAVELGDPAHNDSKGCGAVMRVAPVGLVCAASDDGRFPAFDLGVEVARLTHGHRTGQLASGFFAHLVALLLTGQKLSPAVRDARRVVAARDASDETVRAIDAALALAESEEPPTPDAVGSLGSGWVAEEAVSIAIYCALSGRSFEQGVCLAVNHVGDSNSTGSLAASLLGAAHGVAAIPERWLDALELREVIEEVGDDLAALRDGRLDLERSFAKYPGW